jgi:SpoVK/Ycf46/Vps4 family AAA+-type ATPase
MRQGALWRRHWQQMSAEQKKKSIMATIFHRQKGDGIALTPIFIEPALALKPGTATLTDKRAVTDLLNAERQTIWTLLSSPSPYTRHCLIVGPPGCGKTTLLQHTASLLARKRRQHHRRTPDILPIFLSLPIYTALIESRADFSLVDAFGEQMQQWGHQTVPGSWVEGLLDAGKCVVLLDGLDAIADQLACKHLAVWVQQQMRTYRQNRFIVTARSHGECETLLEEDLVLEICPFSLEQIEQYTQQWFDVNVMGKYPRKVQKGAFRQQWAQEYLRQLDAVPSLRALASNPLDLMLLTFVYHYRQVLPTQRGLLSMEILCVLHDQLKRLQGMQACTVSQLQKVLAFLAWSMLQEGKEEFSINEAQHLLAPYLTQLSPLPQADTLLNMICTCGDVLLMLEGQHYRFAHRTVQAYFAAMYAKEQGLEQVLANQIGNSWWHETIHLFCTQADATYLLQSCLEYPGTPTPVLALIGSCLEEGSPLEQSLRVRSELLTEELLEDPDPAKRQTAAEVWLRKRLREMIALGEGTYRDRSLVTCAEYQLFLDAQQLHGRFYQPDHWKTISVPEGQSREAVLGVRASDARAFCQWLTQRDTEGWQYRLPVLDEWNNLMDNKEVIFKGLSPGSGCWIAMEPESGNVWKGRNLPLLDMTNSIIHTLVPCDWSRQPADLADFARPLRLAHNLTCLLSCDLERDLTPNLAFALERLHGCDLEQSFAHAHTWFNILQQMQILAMAHTSDLLRALIGDLRGRTTAQESNRMFTHVRDLASLLVSAGDLSRDLLSMLEQALDRGGSSTTLSRERAEDILRSEDRKTLLLASLRSCTLHLACFLCKLASFLFSEDVTRWFQQFLRGKDYADLDKGALERTIAGYLDLYLTLVSLELRRQEQVPAWEGILLVKERAADVSLAGLIGSHIGQEVLIP